MRHSQLKAFHHVATTGGFSRAAEALGQTQPAISEQVRRLEQAHDVLLFHRDGRQVRLTEAGAALLRLTQGYFEAEARIEEHLSRSGAALDGTLRIVADSAIHITGAIGRFRAAHPRVTVSVRTGNTEAVLRSLRNYEAEVGVVGNHQPARDLEAVDLGQTRIVAIASKGLLPASTKALGLADLARHPLVFREQGSRTRAALEHLAAQATTTLTPAVEVEGREAMREIVASGAGIGFVSQAELGFDTRLQVVAITGEDLSMRESLVYLSMRADLPLIRSFLRHL